MAPAWSLAVGQAGKISIWAAIAFFVLALLGYALAGKRPSLGKLASGSFVLGSLGLAAAFGCLITLFVQNQFHFEYVFARADIHTDLKYKVAGVWSGQQGSFMLWGVCSALFGILALKGTGPYLRGFGATYSLFLGSIAGILAYETPFNVIKELVENGHTHTLPTGNGMTPSLQNYWIVIHPPTIFLGFGALTILFAYAVAAMLHGDVKEWAKRVRPWSLAALGILALGICMGGFWAYETLGWGGFWMWDPVENASFVPWLLLAAFVHGIIVQVSKSRWHGTNLWFAALPFLAFLYGTFLTRSGSLGDTSVHSFANMDRAALNVLKGVMAVCFFGFTGLYFWRGRALAKAEDRTAEVNGNLHREKLYSAGVIFLALLGLVLAIGMSWPMFMAMAGKSVARIEEPAYHKVIFYFFLPIILLIAIAPFVTWRGMGWRALGARLVNVISIAAGLVGFTLIAMRGPSWGLAGLKDPQGNPLTVAMPLGFRMNVVPWVAFLLVLCSFAAVANLWRLVETMRRSRSSAGAFLSHFGLATLLAGLIVSRGFEQDQTAYVDVDRPTEVLGYTVQYKDLQGKGLNDRDQKLVLSVTAPNGEPFEARPGLFFNRDMQTGKEEPFVWPHVERGLTHDVYIALGRPLMFAWEGEGQWFKPGETQTINEITVRYDKMTTSGALGTPTAKFTAHLKVTLQGKTYEVAPTLSARDMTSDIPWVGPDLRVAIMGMDAKDRSVKLQMVLPTPVYPIHMFTKPLTGLVWLGTGILFLGGLLSAWARRRPRTADVEEEEPSPTTSPSPATKPTSKDAPVPAT